MKIIANSIPSGLSFYTLEVTSSLQTGHYTFITGVIEASHLILSSSSFVFDSDFTGYSFCESICATTVGG